MALVAHRPLLLPSWQQVDAWVQTTFVTQPIGQVALLRTTVLRTFTAQSHPAGAILGAPKGRAPPVIISSDLGEIIRSQVWAHGRLGLQQGVYSPELALALYLACERGEDTKAYPAEAVAAYVADAIPAFTARNAPVLAAVHAFRDKLEPPAHPWDDHSVGECIAMLRRVAADVLYPLLGQPARAPPEPVPLELTESFVTALGTSESTALPLLALFVIGTSPYSVAGGTARYYIVRPFALFELYPPGPPTLDGMLLAIANSKTANPLELLALWKAPARLGTALRKRAEQRKQTTDVAKRLEGFTLDEAGPDFCSPEAWGILLPGLGDMLPRDAERIILAFESHPATQRWRRKATVDARVTAILSAQSERTGHLDAAKLLALATAIAEQQPHPVEVEPHFVARMCDVPHAGEIAPTMFREALAELWQWGTGELEDLLGELQRRASAASGLRDSGVLTPERAIMDGDPHAMVGDDDDVSLHHSDMDDDHLDLLSARTEKRAVVPETLDAVKTSGKLIIFKKLREAVEDLLPGEVLNEVTLPVALRMFMDE